MQLAFDIVPEELRAELEKIVSSELEDAQSRCAGAGAVGATGGDSTQALGLRAAARLRAHEKAVRAAARIRIRHVSEPDVEDAASDVPRHYIRHVSGAEN